MMVDDVASKAISVGKLASLEGNIRRAIAWFDTVKGVTSRLSTKEKE